eukprot:966156_1
MALFHGDQSTFSSNVVLCLGLILFGHSPACSNTDLGTHVAHIDNLISSVKKPDKLDEMCDAFRAKHLHGSVSIEHGLDRLFGAFPESTTFHASYGIVCSENPVCGPCSDLKPGEIVLSKLTLDSSSLEVLRAHDVRTAVSRFLSGVTALPCSPDSENATEDEINKYHICMCSVERQSQATVHSDVLRVHIEPSTEIQISRTLSIAGIRYRLFATVHEDYMHICFKDSVLIYKPSVSRFLLKDRPTALTRTGSSEVIYVTDDIFYDRDLGRCLLAREKFSSSGRTNRQSAISGANGGQSARSPANEGNITSECSGGQSTRSPANESGPSRGSNANEAGPSRGSNTNVAGPSRGSSANVAGPSRGSSANERRRNPPRKSRETTHGIGPDHINTTSVIFSDRNITSECSGGQSTRSPANESGPSRGSNADKAQDLLRMKPARREGRTRMNECSRPVERVERECSRPVERVEREWTTEKSTTKITRNDTRDRS